MPTSCCVFGCSTNSIKNYELSFHMFPKDQKRLKVWCIKIRRNITASNNLRICSKHFLDSDFVHPASSYNGVPKRRKLLNSAIPTQHLPKASFSREIKPRRVLDYKNRATLPQGSEVPSSPVLQPHYVNISMLPSKAEQPWKVSFKVKKEDAAYLATHGPNFVSPVSEQQLLQADEIKIEENEVDYQTIFNHNSNEVNTTMIASFMSEQPKSEESAVIRIEDTAVGFPTPLRQLNDVNAATFASSKLEQRGSEEPAVIRIEDTAVGNLAPLRQLHEVNGATFASLKLEQPGRAAVMRIEDTAVPAPLRQFHEVNGATFASLKLEQPGRAAVIRIEDTAVPAPLRQFHEVNGATFASLKLEQPGRAAVIRIKDTAVPAPLRQFHEVNGATFASLKLEQPGRAAVMRIKDTALGFPTPLRQLNDVNAATFASSKLEQRGSEEPAVIRIEDTAVGNLAPLRQLHEVNGATFASLKLEQPGRAAVMRIEDTALGCNDVNAATFASSKLEQRGSEEPAVIRIEDTAVGNLAPLRQRHDVNVAPFVSTEQSEVVRTKNIPVDHRTPKCSHSIKRFQNQMMSLCWMSDSQIKYCTGFTRAKFDVLFEFVTTKPGFKPYSERVLNRQDQLLMTLFVLRKNVEFKGLTCFFGAARKIASKIFTHWVKAIYVAIKTVDFWASHESQEDQYDIIIDCTEIDVQSCSEAATNQANFSTCKSRPTMKALVGISENGGAIFCSELYPGSTSDRQVVIQSGFLEKLKPGCHVLTDKGFDVSDLLEEKQAVVNIPPFRQKQNQLTEQQVALTRVTNKRLRHYVERFICITKKHRIFEEALPTHLWPLASQMFYITFFFSNFKDNLSQK